MSTKTKIKSGQPVYMVKVHYQDPALYELVGLLGYDCVWICNEHVGIDAAKMDGIIRACRISGMDAVIRIKPANYQPMLHVLEFGAKGIMLPRAQNAQEVEKVVSDMKFYPQGRRGLDGVNAEAAYGLTPMREYIAKANEENFLIVQIEDPETLPHIEEIAALPGVDVLFVGPGDLSMNLGIAGEFEHPRMLQIYEQVVAACQKHGKAAGIPCRPDKLPQYMEYGFRFFAGGADYHFIRNGYTELRAQLEQLGISLR
ncbi:MAG: aldolase/citrate lyase family protein [Lentisphaeria bacterium]